MDKYVGCGRLQRQVSRDGETTASQSSKAQEDEAPSRQQRADVFGGVLTLHALAGHDAMICADQALLAIQRHPFSTRRTRTSMRWCEMVIASFGLC